MNIFCEGIRLKYLFTFVRNTLLGLPKWVALADERMSLGERMIICCSSGRFLRCLHTSGPYAMDNVAISCILRPLTCLWCMSPDIWLGANLRVSVLTSMNCCRLPKSNLQNERFYISFCLLHGVPSQRHSIILSSIPRIRTVTGEKKDTENFMATGGLNFGASNLRFAYKSPSAINVEKKNEHEYSFNRRGGFWFSIKVPLKSPNKTNWLSPSSAWNSWLLGVPSDIWCLENKRHLTDIEPTIDIWRVDNHNLYFSLC